MSLEFRIEKKARGMGISLWEGSQLVDVYIMRCGRYMPLINSQLGMILNLLGVVSEKPNIVSCGDSGVDVLKTLDKMPSSKVCLQYLFSIHELQDEKLLRKPSFSLPGRIDMFAMLNLSLPLPVDCLDFKCIKITM